tara:strand:- start:299 stop:835 length:537 start_codon:yes stop_codon:yes gene_type:complete
MKGITDDSRLLETTINLSVELYLLAHPEEDSSDIRKKIDKLISTGCVAEKFERMVSAQGGPKNILHDYNKYLQKKKKITPVFCKREGYINSIDTKKLGMLLIKLGGARKTPTDKIDYGVGFSKICSINEPIDRKTPILLMHVDDDDLALQISKELQGCFTISEKLENFEENLDLKRVE